LDPELGFTAARYVTRSDLRPSLILILSQIFPTTHRAIGLNVAASFGAIGSIVTAQVWPVGINNIGSKIYFYFMAINLACVPVIFLLYPETKRKSLESIQVLFGGKSTDRILSAEDASITGSSKGNGRVNVLEEQDAHRE
jgi:hypothetical protein